MSIRKIVIVYLNLLLVIIAFLLSVNQAFAQLDCEQEIPYNFNRGWSNADRPINLWTGYVFQINSNYNANPGADWARNFKGLSNGDPKFKGYLLRDANDFLPGTGLNFDTRFSDVSAGGLDEGSFFPTGISPTEPGGCETELQHFGLFLRSRYIVPETGIYRVSVGSDDGSMLRLYYRSGGIDTEVQDVNGDQVGHDNWYKDGSDGLYNFVYEENIRNYYVPLEEGDELWLDLRYYEKNGKSRLSFNMDLYVGPGEIAIATNAMGSASYCGVYPDPPAFLSLGPAVFSDGTEPSYQWQYALVNDPNPDYWNDIDGAIALTYDIPQHQESGPNSWTGTRYFRRVAMDASGINFPTNVLGVNLSAIEDLDQEAYGDNEWIGHIYNGIQNFNSANYLGRQTETREFEQSFMETAYTGPSSQSNYFPEHGCPFYVDEFSVRYKMRMEIEPGKYQFNVRGDDGFRLSLDGGNTWAVNEWANGAARDAPPVYIENSADSVVYLVLEYFENTQNQLINFDYEFTSIVLPLSWGRVIGHPCGKSNCLLWETLQEKNTSHFIMERSSDGFNWDAFGEKIAAQGMSNVLTSYGIRDEKRIAQRTYYRIKQVDNDGKYDYSETISIDNINWAKDHSLPYPNPTASNLYLDSEEEIEEIFIISQDQRISNRIPFKKGEENRYSLNLENYPSSKYLISIMTKKGKVTYLIIKE